MDARSINSALDAGDVATEGVLPHLDELSRSEHVFGLDFGLDELPEQPGLITVRGARQVGKSTWLEGRIRATVEEHGPGSAFYLNGDELRTADELLEATRELAATFSRDAPVRRLFIDEITAVPAWERALKRLVDAGELRKVLVVTTGSKATDLRRGVERLPGRKGRLERDSYLFLPISYREIERVCGARLSSATLPAYVLSGGSPLACSELARSQRLPEYVVTLTRDWILGEFAASRRPRASLLGVMEVLHRFGGTPVGQAKLAREADLANNTVAAGYVELLADLLCVAPSYAWDASRRAGVRRRPYKLHFVNGLAAAAWHPAKPRSVADFLRFSPEEQGKWTEWLVAQELWRRRARAGEELPELLHHWQGRRHELDFVVGPEAFIEVRRGAASPLDFAWFAASFPGARLTVVNPNRFETDQVRGVPLRDWLVEDG